MSRRVLGRQFPQVEGQLAMLHTAQELRDHGSMDAMGWPTKEAMWQRKLVEAKRGPGSQSLYGAIKEQGVQQPVDLIHGFMPRPMLADGHHRVAAAHDLDPKMLLPVRHRETVRHR